MKARVSLLALVIVVSGTAGCALSGGQKHTATVASTALYTAIAAVDDVEMTLFTAGQITPAQHATLNPKIITLLRAGKAANDAVAAWPQGKPAPAELQAAVQQLGAVAQEVAALLPDGATKAKIQAAIILAQQAITAALVLAPTLEGDQTHGQTQVAALRAGRRGVSPDRRGDDRARRDRRRLELAWA